MSDYSDTMLDVLTQTIESGGKLRLVTGAHYAPLAEVIEGRRHFSVWAPMFTVKALVHRSAMRITDSTGRNRAEFFVTEVQVTRYGYESIDLVPPERLAESPVIDFHDWKLLATLEEAPLVLHESKEFFVWSEEKVLPKEKPLLKVEYDRVGDASIWGLLKQTPDGIVITERGKLTLDYRMAEIKKRKAWKPITPAVESKPPRKEPCPD